MGKVVSLPFIEVTIIICCVQRNWIYAQNTRSEPPRKRQRLRYGHRILHFIIAFFASEMMICTWQSVMMIMSLFFKRTPATLLCDTLHPIFLQPVFVSEPQSPENRDGNACVPYLVTIIIIVKCFKSLITELCIWDRRRVLKFHFLQKFFLHDWKNFPLLLTAASSSFFLSSKCKEL